MSASFCDCVNQWEQVLGLQVLKETKHLWVRTRRGPYHTLHTKQQISPQARPTTAIYTALQFTCGSKCGTKKIRMPPLTSHFVAIYIKWRHYWAAPVAVLPVAHIDEVHICSPQTPHWLHDGCCCHPHSSAMCMAGTMVAHSTTENGDGGTGTRDTWPSTAPWRPGTPDTWPGLVWFSMEWKDTLLGWGQEAANNDEFLLYKSSSQTKPEAASLLFF